SSTCYVCASHRLCLFFFQAEDGIRDRNVTGVQTCALPILIQSHWMRYHLKAIIQRSIMLTKHQCTPLPLRNTQQGIGTAFLLSRSEERRVGKECTFWLSRRRACTSNNAAKGRADASESMDE